MAASMADTLRGRLQQVACGALSLRGGSGGGGAGGGGHGGGGGVTTIRQGLSSWCADLSTSSSSSSITSSSSSSSSSSDCGDDCSLCNRGGGSSSSSMLSSEWLAGGGSGSNGSNPVLASSPADAAEPVRPARAATASSGPSSSRQLHTASSPGTAAREPPPAGKQQLASDGAAGKMHRSWSWTWGASSRRSGSGAQPLAAAASSSGRPRSASWRRSSRPMMTERGLAAMASASALHPAVLAHLQGSLGAAFSGGGFRFTYFIGVSEVLHHTLGLVAPSTPLSGASSGALIAVFLRCGLPVGQVVQLTHEMAQDVLHHGLHGRLGLVLRRFLEAHLPPDAHLLCDGNTFLAATKVWPMVCTHLLSSFSSRSELINAMMTSCHLPSLSDGSYTVAYRGRLHIDGGLLSVLTPPPDVSHSVLVCSMPSSQIARLPAFISRPAQADISISPDSFRPWPFSRQQTTALALQPPSPAFVDHLVARGRADALAWAERVGLTRQGVPLWPSAQRLAQLREQLGVAVAPGGSSATGSADNQVGWELLLAHAMHEGLASWRDKQQAGRQAGVMSGSGSLAEDVQSVALVHAAGLPGVADGTAPGSGSTSSGSGTDLQALAGALGLAGCAAISALTEDGGDGVAGMQALLEATNTGSGLLSWML